MTFSSAAPPQVVAVHSSTGHTFSKFPNASIRLIADQGVEGDAHRGATIKHRSRVAKDPSQPNLRQVHLVHVELLEELAAKGFPVQPGSIGENITTRGVDLLGLVEGAELHIGAEAVVIVTGLRNPCVQLTRFSPGLMEAVIERTTDGGLRRKAGIMGIVRTSGMVLPGDNIRVVPPIGSARALRPV